MDDSATKIPTIVTLVHLESNALHEKQLSFGETLVCAADHVKRALVAKSARKIA